MYQNFIFEELNGTKHFFRWNPTKVTTDLKDRELFESLDGPPLVRTLDGTETINAFVWENAPRYKEFQYDQIADLVGKKGYIRYNKMPQLVGNKNMFNHSYFDFKNAEETTWDFGCIVSGDGSSCDGSCLAPDGISMVHLWKSVNTTTNATFRSRSPCISTNSTDYTLAEYTLFYAHIKYSDATKCALNIRNQTSLESNIASFNIVDGTPVLNQTIPGASVSTLSAGVIDCENNDWFILWLGLDIKDSGYSVGDNVRLFVYPSYYCDLADPPLSNYVWGMQLEYGVDYPTWFCPTDGTAVNEEYFVEFLDLQTEYIDLPGIVKHNLVLTYKLIGDWQ